MTIKGEIQDIIFRNDDNGYTVCVVDANGEMVTAVGRFPQLNIGETVELTGSFVAHNKYGQQFSVKNIRIVPPSTNEGMIRYLSSGLIKGVGVITAQNIVNEFGKSTFDIIEYNPHKLAEVRGISLKKAEEIAESFREIKSMQNAVMLMQDYNISTNLAIKIYNFYQNQTEEILKTNPYKLVEDIDGIGFFTADKIAMKMGVEPESDFRIRAAVLHLLKENSDKNGNTYIKLNTLLSQTDELLKISVTSHFEDIITKLVMDGVIKRLSYNDEEIVMLTTMFNIEKLIASTLNVFKLYDHAKCDVRSDIKLFETLNKIKLHENQIEALEMAANNNVSVITGGPGTGKTTIIKCLLYLFGNMNRKVKLVAPTGRAAKRLSESTGREASTIHRALEVDFSGANKFNFNFNNKLPCDVIIIDEVSMVDVQLFFYLIRALRNGTQIVLVGDKDQLPSVGAGNLLADIINSGVIPVCYLTHIYRQDDNSLIVTNAHLINNGKMPTINNKSKDFFFEYKEDPNDILRIVKDMQLTRIPKFTGIDVAKIQVLSAMKSGVCGVENINKVLQDAINPPAMFKREVEQNGVIYRVGDRVMQIVNNYERSWKKDGYFGGGVFNGDIGKIIEINNHTGEVFVEFEDGRECMYTRPDLGELVLSYAITIHKSQGSEFDVVIIPIVAGPPMLLSRNLLYTAVTRAKSMVVLVGSTKVLNMMVKNNHTQERYTMLCEFLKTTKLEGIN